MEAMKKPLSKIDSLALTTMTLVIVFLIPRSFPLSRPQHLLDIEPSKSESKSCQGRDSFDITEVNRQWILKKSNIRKTINREISCSVLDEKTGPQCSWETTDSKRQSSTSNIVEHIRKRHSIEAQERPEPAKKPKSSRIRTSKFHR
ncbi:hypothetical protein V1515DRAFT_577774 [Lipomyces mesembrius]